VKTGPDIARVASLIGDPARANMLTALLGGEARTAGELAREAGVSAQTASSHLEKLHEGGIVSRRAQGRHRYYTLSGADIGSALEQLMTLAERTGHRRTRPGPSDPALRLARVCYDHLAGDMGVAMLEGMIAKRLIVKRGDTLVLSARGRKFVAEFGIDLDAAEGSRRPLCKSCLDWSVRRSHLAGSLGAMLLRRFTALGWAKRRSGTRVLAFTAKGASSFEATFGLAG
jgi:DNA-binding transcriptional ArsR family regulator